MRETTLRGKVWVLLDQTGKLIEDIDTDQIFHNAHLHITDISEMGPYAFGNLEGWKDFSKKCGEGDIVVAGRNFGAGSSRQQAVECLIALKVGAVIAPSFSAIYFRNAVNSGFPVLRLPKLETLVVAGKLKTGDLVEVDMKSGGGMNLTQKLPLRAEPMSRVQVEIYTAGDLFQYGKILNEKQ
jgi:3-isopropylmalate/(R)-2-methylmalate dehydratase small subunit